MTRRIIGKYVSGAARPASLKPIQVTVLSMPRDNEAWEQSSGAAPELIPAGGRDRKEDNGMADRMAYPWKNQPKGGNGFKGTGTRRTQHMEGKRTGATEEHKTSKEEDGKTEEVSSSQQDSGQYEIQRDNAEAKTSEGGRRGWGGITGDGRRQRPPWKEDG